MLDRKWYLLIVYSALMCVSMSLPIFGGSIVNTAMARALKWDATALGLLVVVNMAAASLLLPIAAKLIGKFGVRLSMIGGFLSMVVGAAALSTMVSTPGQAVIAYGIAMGITSSFSGVLQCQAGVAALFPSQRTLAFSVLYAGTAIVTFGILSLISFGIAATGDWKTGWHIVLAAAVVAIGLVLAFVREPRTSGVADGPGEGFLPPPPPPGTAAVYPGLTVAQVLRMPLFWIIALSMIAITAGSISLAAHAQLYLIEKGFSAQTAASSMSTLQIGMILGNLSLGFVAARIELHRAMALVLICYATSFAVLANVQGLPMVTLFAVLAGVGYGAGQVGTMALIGHYWDMKVFPMLAASGLIAQTVGSAAAPILAGKYYDDYGSLVPPIYFMMTLCLVIAIAMLIAGRPPRPAGVSIGDESNEIQENQVA